MLSFWDKEIQPWISLAAPRRTVPTDPAHCGAVKDHLTQLLLSYLLLQIPVNHIFLQRSRDMLFLELPVTLVEDICYEAACSEELFDVCRMREVNRTQCY